MSCVYVCVNVHGFDSKGDGCRGAKRPSHRNPNVCCVYIPFESDLSPGSALSEHYPICVFFFEHNYSSQCAKCCVDGSGQFQGSEKSNEPLL